MLIEIIITLDDDTERQLFEQPWALRNLRRGIARATAELERETKRLAPKATGEFRDSIDSEVREYGQPFRFVCRVSSSHPAADVIEYGAGPHTVPIRAILRWMQAVKMPISPKISAEEVAHRIQHKIETQGLPPHHTFTAAARLAEPLFRSYIDPTITAIRGTASIDIDVRTSGSHALPWE